MTVIHRYLIRSFMKYFAIVLAMVVVIYLSIDFFGKIDNFLASDLGAGQILLFFLYKIPLIVSQITPVGVLLSVLIVFGLMNKNNEIVALKSSGISVFYLLLPIAVLGVIFSVALFVFSEAVVPISISRSNRIEAREEGAGKMMTSREKNIWIRHADGLAHVKYYHPANQTLRGISVYVFDDDFNLVERIDAERAEFAGGRWLLYDAMLQRLKGADKDIDIRFHAQMEETFDLVPSDFQRVVRDAEEMSFASLWRYIRKMEAEGYDATEYRVDLFGKTAFPFVCFIMCLMGGTIALRGKTGDGMAVSFAYGLVTAFLYWSVYSFCLSLGYGQLLPPWLAAWTANFVFACSAGLMLLNLE
ncbi:MAG: LPS export ABC transporter permease LptG [Thermodesulfobacteriota bacterium]